jgi:Na+-transporting NADH:ubiquinone oxidoreductase subunit C
MELSKPIEERNLPIYIYTAPTGEEINIVPLQGKGLWGPIWGYVSLQPDMSTVYGAIFAHAKETPGLGAEISEDFFQDQFPGKKLYDEGGQFRSIAVVKGGAGLENPHAVDAITGGTITSVALQDMFEVCIEPYTTYFKSKSISHE